MGRECWSWCRTTSASGVADYVLQLADHGMALLSLDVSTTEDVSPICVSAAFHDLFTKAGSDCLQRQRRFVPPFCRAFFVLSVLYRVLPCSVRTHMFSCPLFVVSVEETPPPAELLCLDVLHKSTDDGAVVTLTPCALGDAATSGDGGFDEQKWEFLEVWSV